MAGTAEALKLLIGKRNQIDRAIAILEDGAPRRGPSPGSENITKPKARKTRGWSEEAKQRQAKKMKAYWAKRRRAAKAG